MTRPLFLLLALGLLTSWRIAQAAPAATDNTASIALPDAGWRLWPDTKATWRNDQTSLPEDVHLEQMPENAPTGGWGVLNGQQGILVTLPSTVEQHDWGKFGFRPYTGGEYVNADSDPQVVNGNYEGVSWWWRTLAVPASFAGKVAILHIRGARQRAEVYLNQTLVGYSMVEETGFDCDVTRALRPGRPNTLAIRITNPGGRLDWGDWMTRTWGQTTFFLDHGFGGLDRGITLTAHAPVYVADAWALNTPDPRAIQAHVRLHNRTRLAANGTLVVTVIDPRTGVTLAAKTVTASAAAGTDQEVEADIRCPEARLWDTGHPNLYWLHVSWQGVAGTKMADARDVTFGFRWFAPDGIGQDAVLRLNGRRLRVYSAISWGFWGLNGLWPTPALAVKEVTAAKRLGLNCLNFHRNMGKAEVFDAQDRLGLLRYMEPGGGQFAIGKHTPTDSGEASSSLEKYQEDRILNMIRDARSHPSLVIYVVQNEADFDLKNPRVFYLLRRMHREDPSRTVVLKSGIETHGEAWMKPYDDTVYYDHGDGYSGWSDHHTVGYPEGTWHDSDYKGPTDFIYRTDNTKEIVDWGEMGGAAAPDNHALMVAQIKKAGGSYDLKDHQEILDAYNLFLDKWGFRAAFPTARDLFVSIGDKEYDYWNNVLECARLSEPNDYLTVSGWESTAIEDHSGLVDNLRNFKGHPGLIRDSLKPLLPVVRTRAAAIRTGETATLDLFLLNETNRPAPGTLRLTLTDPQGRTRRLAAYPAPAFQKDRFVYPIRAGLTTPPLKAEGVYKITFALAGSPDAQETKDVRVIAPRPLPNVRVGVVGANPGLLTELNALAGVHAEAYHAAGVYDVAITGGAGGGEGSVHPVADVTIANTDDQSLYHAERFGNDDNLAFTFNGLPIGPVQVTLYFAETYWSAAGKRVFDVVANDKTVLKDFDIFAAAGGPNRAVAKTFTVDSPQGSVVIRPGVVSADFASFSAIKLQGGGKTVGVYFGEHPYTDKSGLVWQPYHSSPIGTLSAILDRLRGGLSLLVDAPQDSTADVLAKQLAAAGAFTYKGLVGAQRAPWMGDWYFVRAHPAYDGLPVNEAMRGDYQTGPSGANGLLVNGPGVAIITAYSRDHDREIGAADFTARLGRGRLLFHCMPPMQPVMQERWLANALAFLTKPPAGK